LNLAREVVEGDDGRNCDEDTQGRRDQGLSDAARNHRHSAGPRGRDAQEGVNDSDHGAEKTDERGSGADRGKEPKTPLQLNQHFGYGVPDCARDELERSDRIEYTLARADVLMASSAAPHWRALPHSRRSWHRWGAPFPT